MTETTTTSLSLEDYEALAADEQVGFTKEDNTYTKTVTNNVGSKIGVYGEVLDDFLAIDKNYLDDSHECFTKNRPITASREGGKRFS